MTILGICIFVWKYQQRLAKGKPVYLPLWGWIGYQVAAGVVGYVGLTEAGKRLYR